jgi:hypothetical protein
MKITRRIPWYVVSNVVANYPDDPYNRDVNYLRDPQGWVRAAFDQALETLGPECVVCICNPGGYDRDANPPAEDFSLFREQEAADAWMECAGNWKGGRALYTGSLAPPSFRQLSTNQDDEARACYRAIYPYIQAGLTHWGLDATAPDSANLQGIATAMSIWGVRVYGEAVPYDQNGIDPYWTGRLPYVCSWEFWLGNLGAKASLDPKRTECHTWYDDWLGGSGQYRYPDVKQAISAIDNAHNSGLTVGLLAGARPEVVAHLRDLYSTPAGG